MKKVFLCLMVFVFGVLLHGLTMAQTIGDETTLSPTLMPSMIEGTGTHFEVTDSEYLNIVLDSSETITLRLESVPEMVTMHIESASEATSTQITISGFEPSTTYYKYEDNYHNLVEFTTDGNGSYSWTQDLSQLHLVFIQPRESTKFIKDDATGGDCYLIGIWDSTTKTCTLTTDVYETIQIDSNYITLDGNGHTVTGTGTGYGVYLYYERRGVTVKGLNIKNFIHGIGLWHSNNNTLKSNIVSNNHEGIFMISSNNNTLVSNSVSNNQLIGVTLVYSNYNMLIDNIASGNSIGICVGCNAANSNNNYLRDNIASNNSQGIALNGSQNNILINNTAQENAVWDLNVFALRDSDCNNIIQSTTGSGGRPTKYFNSAVNLDGEILSELILCNADYSNINNVTIAGSETLKNNVLLVIRTDYSNIINTASSNNNYGLYFYSSNNNTITDNTASSNFNSGIYFQNSHNNTITSNIVSDNSYVGIYLISSSNNQIYNNNFINNWRQQAYVWGSGNIFNLEKPTGGNYWSNFDTPAEGCYDTNYDGFCDAPYYFPGGVDYLPWTKQNGWEVPADTTPPTTTIILYGTSGNNGWYISNVQVTLTAVDNQGGSGVKKTEYSFDGTTWNTYLAPFTISNEGTTTIYCRSTDNAGNVETTKSISVKIDKTSPTITTIVSPTPDANGWNNTDVTVSFTCSDSTSGIASCPSPITVTTEGAGQVISGTAIDKAGNSASTSVTLNIDNTPPVANVSVSPGYLWPPNHKMVDVAINGGASDSTSQVTSIVFTVKDEYGKVEPVISGFNTTIPLEAWREGTDRDGRVYTITVVVTDNAGNQSTATAEVIVPHDMRK